MATYVDKNSSLPDMVQRALGKLSAKLPGWDYAQIVYTDAWGRTEKNTQSDTLNAIYQFLSPGYVSTIEESAMESELMRLYEATGETSVLISNAPKYFTVDGVRKDLTGAEYTAFNTTRGQTALSIMSALTESEAYANLSDAEKVKAVERVYDFATQSAKYELTDGAYKADKWVVNSITAAYDVDLPVETVVLYRTMISSLEDSNPGGFEVDGETLSLNDYVRQQIFADSQLSAEQKHALDEIVLSDGIYLVQDVSVDYTNEDTFILTQMSEAGQKKWPIGQRYGLTAEEYNTAWGIYYNQDYNADEKRAQFRSQLGLTVSEAENFYRDLDKRN